MEQITNMSAEVGAACMADVRTRCSAPAAVFMSPWSMWWSAPFEEGFRHFHNRRDKVLATPSLQTHTDQTSSCTGATRLQRKYLR